MKSLLLLLGNLVFAVSTLLGVLVAVDRLSASEPEPHRFHSLYSAGLWTSQPTPVDASAQKLERVGGSVIASAAAQPSPANTQPASAAPREIASLDPSAGMERVGNDDLTGNAVNAAGSAAPVDQNLLAHQDWCMQHYRSYNAADNTYRSFSGQRRVCQSPVPQTEASAQQASLVSQVGMTAVTPGDDHVRSCMQRYRSYRVEDNSYQPFDGGPRRTCR